MRLALAFDFFLVGFNEKRAAVMATLRFIIYSKENGGIKRCLALLSD